MPTNVFDQLVMEAFKSQPGYTALRPVVEKELLHHEIFRVFRDQHLLSDLTFIGGTCLRACYGSVRLSEDLDFTGGPDFAPERLSKIAPSLTKNIKEKYGLALTVSEPKRDQGAVSTWKIMVETRPKTKHMPTQRIHIDICAYTSYEKKPALLRNPYAVDMGTQGLILQAESLEEIYADKIIAFALRENRIQPRDVWDIFWLHRKGVTPRLTLVPKKLEERGCSMDLFSSLFESRSQALAEEKTIELSFKQEMRRFLPVSELSVLEQKGLWTVICSLIKEIERSLAQRLKGFAPSSNHDR